MNKMTLSKEMFLVLPCVTHKTTRHVRENLLRRYQPHPCEPRPELCVIFSKSSCFTAFMLGMIALLTTPAAWATNYVSFSCKLHLEATQKEISKEYIENKVKALQKGGEESEDKENWVALLTADILSNAMLMENLDPNATITWTLPLTPTKQDNLAQSHFLIPHTSVLEMFGPREDENLFEKASQFPTAKLLIEKAMNSQITLDDVSNFREEFRALLKRNPQTSWVFEKHYGGEEELSDWAFVPVKKENAKLLKPWGSYEALKKKHVKAAFKTAMGDGFLYENNTVVSFHFHWSSCKVPEGLASSRLDAIAP